MKKIVALLMVASLLTQNVWAESDQQSVVLMSDKPLIGLQLWSVRDLLAKDFSGTLEQVANLGFDGVEFARDYGPYNKTQGKALKAYLQNLGLTVAGAHVEFSEFDPENFDQSVQFYQDLAAPYLIIAWDPRAWDGAKVDAFITQLNHLSIRLAAHQLKLGFHNHEQEFNAYQKTTYWDYIQAKTPDSVPLQLDIGWVVMAGKSPAHYIGQYPVNTRTVHYRPYLPPESDKDLVVGQDTVDWPRVIHANHLAKTDWLVLEQTDYIDGLNSLETIATSKKGLDALLVHYYLNTQP